MKNAKIYQIIHNIYVEAYANSTPPADFNQLVETAEINQFGQKVIKFNDYEINHKLLDEIINKHIKYLRKRDKQIIRASVLLGCSPKSKYD